MNRRRIRCSRSCLCKSIRIVNIFVNVFGVGMIIYTIWLLNMWKDGVQEIPLPSRLSLPQPWFILACLGVGITVCLTTLGGHIVANCISNSLLCVYIFSVSSLVLLQAAAVVAIFFKMDFAQQISELIDDEPSFKDFLIFHLHACRFISIVALLAQVNVIVLAMILWLVGSETMSQIDLLDRVPDFKYSFLVSPNSPNNDDNNNQDNNRARMHFEALLATRTHIERYF